MQVSMIAEIQPLNHSYGCYCICYRSDSVCISVLAEAFYEGCALGFGEGIESFTKKKGEVKWKRSVNNPKNEGVEQ